MIASFFYGTVRVKLGKRVRMSEFIRGDTSPDVGNSSFACLCSAAVLAGILLHLYRALPTIGDLGGFSFACIIYT